MSCMASVDVTALEEEFERFADMFDDLVNMVCEDDIDDDLLKTILEQLARVSTLLTSLTAQKTCGKRCYI